MALRVKQTVPSLSWITVEKDPKYKDAHLCIINIEVIACNYSRRWSM